MRIKKKEVVLPFRQTLAYRMILLAASVITFVIAMFVTFRTMTTATTTTMFIVSGVILVAATLAVFYNLGHLRDARIPKQTLHKMKRR